MKTIATIVPTCGRATLVAALQSLVKNQEHIPGDRIIVVSDGPQPYAAGVVESFALQYPGLFVFCEHVRTGHWGYEQREYAVRHLAQADLLHFLDDDDIATPGAYRTIREYAELYPDRPLVFRTLHKWRQILWQTTDDFKVQRIGGSQFVTPNIAERLGSYAPFDIYECDWHFMRSTVEKWPGVTPAFCDAVICICSPADDNRWTL